MGLFELILIVRYSFVSPCLGNEFFSLSTERTILYLMFNFDFGSSDIAAAVQVKEGRYPEMRALVRNVLDLTR